LLDVARGIRYLHHLNPTLIHGNLKPVSTVMVVILYLHCRQANIVIDEAFNAKICDFGLVRLIQENGSSTGLTTTSAHTGTVRYLAFQLVEDGEVPTTASDVYALGCIGLEVSSS
jgi:serine/threonine protein kinase